MSGLIDINTIALNESNIGTNVNDRFKKIDDNFKKIIGSDYLRGAPGDDIIIGSVTLENPGNDPAKNEGHELFNKFYDLIVGQNNNVDDADAKLIKKELDGRKIMKIYSNSSSTGTQSFLGTYMPFVFKDPRLDQLDNVDTSTISQDSPYIRFTDYSCCIYYDNEKNKWVKLESMPNIYFDNESYQFCWKINGVPTKLIAQGPAGPNGAPGSNVLLARIKDGCKEDIDENMDLAHDITHFFVSNVENPMMPGKWIDVTSKKWDDDYKPRLVLNNNAATLAITRSIKDPILDENNEVQYGVVYVDENGDIEYECKCKCGEHTYTNTIDKCPKCGLDKTDENVICLPVPVKWNDSLHDGKTIEYNGQPYPQYQKREDGSLLEIIRKIEYYWYLGILRLIEEDGKYSYSFVTSKDCLNDIFQNILDSIYTDLEVDNFIENLRKVDKSLDDKIKTEIEDRQKQDESLEEDISDIVGFVAGNVSNLDRIEIDSSEPKYKENPSEKNLLAAVNYKYDKSFINSKVGSMDYQIKRTNYNLSKYDILEPNIKVINTDALSKLGEHTVDIELELNKLTRVILINNDAKISDKLSLPDTNVIINIHLPLMENSKDPDDKINWPKQALEEPYYARNIFPDYSEDKDKWGGLIDDDNINPGIKYSINDYKWEDNWIYYKYKENFDVGIVNNIVNNGNSSTAQELIYMLTEDISWNAAVGIYHTALQLPLIENAVINIMYNGSKIYPNVDEGSVIHPDSLNNNIFLNYYNQAYIAHNFKSSNITKGSPITVTTEAPSEWIMTGYYEITKKIHNYTEGNRVEFIKKYRNIWNIAAAEYYSAPALSEEQVE